MIDYDSSLNEEQRAVVMSGNGPSMVIAGAGSGKTRVVTYRVARLIELGLSPERILLLTFTNKAAREMLSRVEGLIGIDIRRLWGGTFHHIGNLILRRHANLLGYHSSYTILDREDQKDLIEACVSDLSIDTRGKRFPKGEVLSDIISHSTNTEGRLEEITLKRYPMFEVLIDDIKRVSDQYKTKKKELNLMDFDDLLLNLKLLIEGFMEIKAIYSSRFEQILIDEYQDTNRLQAEIIDLLASKNRNLMVVGDDSQSIYSFRGANFNNIIEFPKRYPDAKIYKLETNYRSANEILILANSSISHNTRRFPKRLRAIKSAGHKPLIVPLKDVYQQGEFVADRILELHHNEGLPFNEMAVLYRSHYHSMELQLELTKRGTPFKVRSGLRFFEQAHIKDVASYLKIIANPVDELAWKRVLKLIPGIGKATADRIWKEISGSTEPIKVLREKRITQIIPKKGGYGWEVFCKTLDLISTDEIKKSLGEIIRIILKEGYAEYLQGSYLDHQERSADLNQLAEFASRYRSADDFLGELALLGSVESEASFLTGNEDESVVLSSIHQAKGLEWRVVFIIWLADGRFPTSRSLENPDNEEEERRLFYVGVTRAKDELYLCYPIISEGWSRSSLYKPSRFLEELEVETYSKFIIRDEIYDLMERA